MTSPPPGSPRARLKRSTPLKRSSAPKRHLRVVTAEPGRDEWKQPFSGFCACGCYEYAARLERHHVVLESLVRRHGGRPWDFANSMLVTPQCHRHHHDKFRRIPFDAVPQAAIEFAMELLGPEVAALYFARHYGIDDPGAAA